MVFQFLIAYHRTENVEIDQILAGLVEKVLEDNLNQVEPESITQMIRCQEERIGDECVDRNGDAARYTLLSFTLDFPDEIEQIEAVIEDFCAALSDTEPICHCVKFEDSLLQRELRRRAEDIFALEMKLRRVLTFIYLHANQAGDPYDLLCDESVQPMNKDKPVPAQMKAANENQFFHLTFGQYVNLNQRPDIKQVSGLLEIVRDSATYEDLRAEINRKPVEYEDDAVLLAGLKERMDAIETMRNCVAHNRRPTAKVVENYENALPLVDKLLREYLARWERRAPDGGVTPTDDPEREFARAERDPAFASDEGTASDEATANAQDADATE